MQACPICGRGDTAPLLELKHSPYLQNILYPDAASAQAAPVEDVDFLYCAHCHFAFNPDFKDHKCDYTAGYNNNQLASASYRQYVDAVAEKLAADCGLGPESSILEIGCGDGYFLSRLKEKTRSRDIAGYEPRYAGTFGMEAHVRRAFYLREDVRPFDLIIFRHTFEGLLSFDEILRNVVDSMHERSFLFIETPNLDYILRHKSLGMLCHEIARYYSGRAFDRLFAGRGLVVERVEPVFGGMYLYLLARTQPDVAGVDATFRALAETIGRFRKPLIWGATGRTISTLCHLDLGPERVFCAVDIDPMKQGRFLPHTGQRVLPPEEALAQEPDLIIVSNQNYLAEIVASVGRDMHYLLLDGSLYHGAAGKLTKSTA